VSAKDEFWGFVDRPLTQTAIALVLTVLATILSSRLVMVLAGFLFLLAAFREGWFRHSKWHFVLLRFSAALVLTVSVLTAVWWVAWRFRERTAQTPTVATTPASGTQEQKTLPEPVSEARSLAQPSKMPSKSRRAERATTPSQSPPLASQSPNTVTEIHAPTESLSVQAQHHEPVDKAEAKVDHPNQTGPSLNVEQTGKSNIAQIGNNNTATINEFDPNKPQVRFEVNGVRHWTVPGKTSTDDVEVAAYQKLMEYVNGQDWRNALALAEQEMTRASEWPTLYMVAGQADLNLCNKDKGSQYLKRFLEMVQYRDDYTRSTEMARDFLDAIQQGQMPPQCSQK